MLRDLTMQNRSMHWASFCRLGLAAVLAAAGCIRAAEDLTTVTGKTLRNARVTAVTDSEITVEYEGGREQIPLRELPPDVQHRFSPAELFRQLRDKTRELEELKNGAG